MSIKVQCPQCKLVAAAPDGHAGRHVRCKRCHAKFPLPHGVPTLPVAQGAVGRAPVLPESPVVIDRYEVRELLGTGSFGSVYRAFDPRLGREVALKVLKTEMTASPQTVERFLREAKAAAKLDHPHIVAVFDAGRAGDVYFIASAFIKGGTLKSAIPETGMEPRRAAELAAQLASALGYAHRNGVVHRDVKPANILLDEHGSLRLMDFGLAGWTREECTRLTQQGAIMGTPAYMAPEQALGDTAEIGPASDQYSAGVILYEMLTGCRPFEEGHPAALMYRIVHETPSLPSARRPGLDAALEAICLKTMAKKPADRFADGEAMAAALQAWAPTSVLMAKPMAGPPPAGMPTPVWEWVTETVVPPSAVRTIAPALCPSTAPSNGERLNKVVADHFGRNRMLWAWAFLVVFLAAASAVALLCLYSPQKGADAAIKSINTPALALPDQRPQPDPEPIATEPPDEIVNSIGMRLKFIKPGTFLMGSPKNEEGRFDNEGPQHKVEITKPYYLGVYLVTKSQYAAFAKGVQADDYPMGDVTWNDARAFCDWLSKKEGRVYELPTEAEWEYACRAGTSTRFWCGDADASLKGNANLADASFREKNPGANWAVPWNDGYAFASPVGNYKPNPWGLYDMHGNVYQWCADGYGPYQAGYIKDPKGIESSNTRVLRGGAWDCTPRYCRSALRHGYPPMHRHPNCSFRVCCRLAK